MNSDHAVTPAPDLALVFTSLAVTLLSRPEGETAWSVAGAADIGADDFPDQIGALREAAAALAGAPDQPPPVVLSLPQDHVLQMRLPLAGDPAAQADMARAAVARRIGVPAESVLWALGPVEGDGAVPMTAVLAETVEEAMAYAADWGFAPLGATGPGPDGGPAAPIIAPAPAPLAPPMTPEPDDAPEPADLHAPVASPRDDGVADALLEDLPDEAPAPAAPRTATPAPRTVAGADFGPDRRSAPRRTRRVPMALAALGAAAAALALWIAAPGGDPDPAPAPTETALVVPAAPAVAPPLAAPADDEAAAETVATPEEPAPLLEDDDLVDLAEGDLSQDEPEALETIAAPAPAAAYYDALALAMAPIDDPEPVRAPAPEAPEAPADAPPQAAAAPDAPEPATAPPAEAPAASTADAQQPAPGPAADQPAAPPPAAEAPADAGTAAAPAVETTTADPEPTPEPEPAAEPETTAEAPAAPLERTAETDAVAPPPVALATLMPAPRPGTQTGTETAADGEIAAAEPEPEPAPEPETAAEAPAGERRAAVLPAARPQVVVAAAERRAQAPNRPRPTARPRTLATAAPVLQREPAAGGATRATATGPREGSGDRPRANAPRSVQQAATIRRGLPQGVALLGVFGGNDGRRALVRSENGALVRVRRGDRVDGWTISQVGADTVQLTNGGRTQTLRVAGR